LKSSRISQQFAYAALAHLQALRTVEIGASPRHRFNHLAPARLRLSAGALQVEGIEGVAVETEMRLGSSYILLWRFIAFFAVSVGASYGAGSAAFAQRVLGIDVSAWQGNLSQATWDALQDVDDRDFVFIRSSRGGTTGYYNQSNPDNDNPPGQNTLSQRYDDPYFIQNITRATATGMFAGPYHFSRPDIIATTLNSNGIPNNGTDEANHFLQMAGPWMRPGYLLPVHDLEAGQAQRSAAALSDFAVDFSNRIHEAMGIRPIVYVSQNYANYVDASLPPVYPYLWIARWPQGSGVEFAGNLQTDNPPPSPSTANVYGEWNPNHTVANPYPNGHPWKFWQYSSGERLQSYGSRLDGDVANGNIELVKDHLVPALWMNDTSGQWNDLANWNSGQTPVAPVQGPGQVARVGSMTLPTSRLPGTNDAARNVFGTNDTVILDRPSANITVTHSTGTHNIRKLIVRETLNITGGSLTVGYDPASWQSPLKPNWFNHGPSETINVSAQFSGNVGLSGAGSLRVHTLRVDATRDFSVGGGTLTFNRINLMPHSTSPAEIRVGGTVNIDPLNNAAAVIANGTGSGNSGRVMLEHGLNPVLNVGNGSAAVDVAINVPIVGTGLTKTGPGTLALNGDNNYNGDTVIQQGKLTVTSPDGFNQQFDNEWDIHISTGAILDLNFTGSPDMIGALFLDGVSQRNGIWGAEASGAQFTTPLITGTGRLEVTHFVPPPGDFNNDGSVDAADYIVWRTTDGSPTGYDDWRANFGRTSWGTGSGSGAAQSVIGVPEPASIAMVAVTIGALQLQQRRRRRATSIEFTNRAIAELLPIEQGPPYPWAGQDAA
jgi:autotransporter-associated beta strand protein